MDHPYVLLLSADLSDLSSQCVVCAMVGRVLCSRACDNRAGPVWAFCRKCMSCIESSVKQMKSENNIKGQQIKQTDREATLS